MVILFIAPWISLVGKAHLSYFLWMKIRYVKILLIHGNLFIEILLKFCFQITLNANSTEDQEHSIS
uniref:Peptidyl-prolyl cis-trans isomerase n=1 Tax=Rhizophora mucronata TaxID=61149 RepID=A0A2P2MDH3_RHIMU